MDDLLARRKVLCHLYGICCCSFAPLLKVLASSSTVCMADPLWTPSSSSLAPCMMLVVSLLFLLSFAHTHPVSLLFIHSSGWRGRPSHPDQDAQALVCWQDEGPAHEAQPIRDAMPRQSGVSSLCMVYLSGILIYDVTFLFHSFSSSNSRKLGRRSFRLGLAGSIAPRPPSHLNNRSPLVYPPKNFPFGCAVSHQLIWNKHRVHLSCCSMQLSAVQQVLQMKQNHKGRLLGLPE